MSSKAQVLVKEIVRVRVTTTVIDDNRIIIILLLLLLNRAWTIHPGFLLLEWVYSVLVLLYNFVNRWVFNHR